MSKYTRNCPLCNKELTYSSKYNYQKAKLKKSKCKSCGIKESITDERREKMRDRVEGRNNPMFGMKGELNPFFGKKHTEETKIKIVINRDMSVYRSDEFRKQLADEKMKKYRETQSINNSGTKNNMFGKPSPIGSGNGWSGWYKGWYFRSLKELTYMIKVIERYNLEWESAETKDLTIRYLDYNLIERSYTADFIVNNRYMVEIKPKKLWDSPLIKLKTGAAIEFCNLRGLKYKLIDIDRLSNQEIITLLDNNLIKFIDRYHNMLNNP